MLLSVPLVLEYEAVMTRPEHLKRSGLSRAEVNALLNALISVSEAVRLAFQWRPTLADPGDDMVLEAAVNGMADAIVTVNQRDFRASDRFGIRVLSPKDGWREVRNEKK